ncbi:Exodeoxyribonuclease I subunit D [Ligilactobacillus sp. WC1T17]|uniref:Nuclease SbcCD subunit D n=1 Tax=Ligilactobacillus ruminis TaxID=1623 RepID=A0ABY1A982_9LACO|nr:Exodeoxyribonuclease I subunit D [Ligilactobacillus ruminis]
MKILHTADWHLGKKLEGFSLEEEQNAALSQLEQLAKAEQVDAIVVAGDIYDQKNPADQTITLVNHWFKKFNKDDHFPLLAISGNHDSAAKLAVGDDWYADKQFYMHTKLEQAFEPIEMGNVQFFLLPYFAPYQASEYFQDDTLKTEALAMAKIVAKMKQQFKPDLKHILVAHFFAAGSSKTDSDSQSEVGGLAAVPLDLLEVFDYVALGHLHGYQASKHPTIKYSGSPVKYSLSEQKQTKGCFIVDTNKDTVTFKALTPLHDLVALKGDFEDLLQQEVKDEQAFFYLTLTNEVPIIEAYNRLKAKYPRLVQFKYAYKNEATAENEVKLDLKQDPLTLLTTFFGKMAKGQNELTPYQLEIAKDCLEEAKKEETK